VLLVYEDFSTGLRARQTFEEVASQLELDADFEVNLWRFDLLRESALRERAAIEAAKADMCSCLRTVRANCQGRLTGGLSSV